MDIAQAFRQIGENISTAATVKNIYGEAVTSGGRTVIPVASIRCAFGAGGGNRTQSDSKEPHGGGGGGGRIAIRPRGLVEITPAGTRFVYFEEWETIALVGVASLLLGLLVGSFLPAEPPGN